MALQRRVQAGKDGKGVPMPILGGEWADPFPHVVDFVSQETWADGQSRVTGTIMFMWELGSWKIWVHDRDGACGCFLTGATPESCLETLEGVLASGGGDWRPDRSAGKKR
jgi:hypothetical protein